MKAFHVLGGVPRSGSTLLANLLNQNPTFYASSTSHTAAAISHISVTWSGAPEVKSDSIRNWSGTQERARAACHGYLNGWFKDHSDKIVIEKSRLWQHSLRLWQWLYPDGKLIIVHRDLGEVFASMEESHAKSIMFDSAVVTREKTIQGRADSMFDLVKGPIGLPIMGIEDLLRRDPDCVHYISYKELVTKPRSTLRDLYEVLDLPDFEHDFKNVDCTAEDVDGLYHYKFPHSGSSGPVKECERDVSKWVSKDIRKLIEAKFHLYNSSFGYLPKRKDGESS